MNKTLSKLKRLKIKHFSVFAKAMTGHVGKVERQGFGYATAVAWITLVLLCTAALPLAAGPFDLADEEAHASFNYFWDQANSDPSSPGYGLVRDRWPNNSSIASVASTGFGLTALVIGAERGWVSRSDAEARARGTLETFLRLRSEHGFFFHFLDMNTGKRAWECEVSIIDTGLFLAGALAAGKYFGGDILDKALTLYDQVEWPWFVDNAQNRFWMAYKPETGFGGHWDFYAEQLILYVLAAGSRTYPVDPRLYEGFTRHVAAYENMPPFIHSWFGSLFTYQYSHAWLDFRGLRDRSGVDWFENSVTAIQSQRQYAIDNCHAYQTFGPNSWGLSASDGPNGYNGRYGAPPSGYDNSAHFIDGTVPPSAAVGSIVFLRDEALSAITHYRSIPQLWGDYGFIDAYNLDKSPAWFDTDVIGIDKGIGLLMIANAEDELVWKIFMKLEVVQQGFTRLGFCPAVSNADILAQEEAAANDGQTNTR